MLNSCCVPWLQAACFARLAGSDGVLLRTTYGLAEQALHLQPDNPHYVSTGQHVYRPAMVMAAAAAVCRPVFICTAIMHAGAAVPLPCVLPALMSCSVGWRYVHPAPGGGGCSSAAVYGAAGGSYSWL